MINKKYFYLLILMFGAVSFSCSNEKSHYRGDWKDFQGGGGNHPNGGNINTPHSLKQPGPPAIAEDTEDLELDPNHIAFRGLFNGKILADNVRILQEWGDTLYTPTPEHAGVFKYISQKEYLMTINATIKLIAEQSIGDGTTSVLKQTLIAPTDSSTALKDGFFEGDSSSGTVTLTQYRGNASSCAPPSPLSCISSIKQVPLKGNPRTICFADPKTEDIAAIPLGVNELDLAAAKALNSKIFGPFIVMKFEGEHTDCSKLVDEPQSVAEIEIVLHHEVDNEVIAQANKLLDARQQASHGLTFEIRHLKDGQIIDKNRAPYLDDLIGLQTRSTYFFSATDNGLVGVAKEMRKKLKQTKSTWAFGYKGFFAEVFFQYCKNELFPDSTNYCSIAATE